MNARQNAEREDLSEAINAELEQEFKMLDETSPLEPHQFAGARDRDCTACGLPDRHPIHRRGDLRVELE